MGDQINPPHYAGDEVQRFIESRELGFSLGNVIKYVARAGHKPGADVLTDLRKAKWYVEREIQRLGKEDVVSEFVPTSTYVPTLDEVETAFHEFASDLETRFPGEYEKAPEFADWREAMHGFRRWLAEYTRVKQAEAWEQGKDAREQVPYWRFEGDDPRLDNPYRKEESDE